MLTGTAIVEGGRARTCLAVVDIGQAIVVRLAHRTLYGLLLAQARRCASRRHLVTGPGDLREGGVAGMDTAVKRFDTRIGEHALNTADLPRRCDEHDEPFLTGTRGASGAVQVVLGIARRVDLQHQVDVVDVDAACCDIGGDEDIDAALLEVVDGLGT